MSLFSLELKSGAANYSKVFRDPFNENNNDK